MSRIIGLFPVPVMHAEGVLPSDLVARLCAWMVEDAALENPKSGALRHTDVVEPPASDLYMEVRAAVLGHVIEFGAALFGQSLGWKIKEIWSNVLDPGGAQAVHAHTNSFVSGVVYLSESHPSARTVFHRGFGGRDFLFTNDNPEAETGPFSGSRWTAPPTRPGDLLLFPSYLPHEVPINRGERRLTVAFNAIPARLASSGYAIRFDSRAAARD